MLSKILFGLEAIVFIWFVIYAITKAQNCKSLFTAPKNTEKNYLKGHVIERMSTETESLCRIMCYNTDTCVSYNYKKDSTACEINDSDHIQHPQDFVEQSGYVYVGTENACQNSPCYNNSACRTNIRDETNPHWCICPPGFQGPTCSRDIDECQTSSALKCPEFSTCQNTIGSFHCQCNVGYKMNDFKCVVDPKIVCENKGRVQLSCNQGTFLNIYWALYGRSTTSICPHPSMKVCGNAETSLKKVASHCQEKKSCSFSSNTQFFGGIDPCPGFYKYTEVRYNCT